MKILKYLIFILALGFFGILGVATAIAKWGNQVKTEAPKVEATGSNHYLMPSIFPQVKR